MMTVKNLVESITGCEVKMGKTYYGQGAVTRSVHIIGLPKGKKGDKIADNVAEVLTLVPEVLATITTSEKDTVIKLFLPLTLSWSEYQNILEDFVESEEFAECVQDKDALEEAQEEKEKAAEKEVDEEAEKKEEEKKQDEVSISIEAQIDNLHVGFNFTTLGIGYASDEKDLQKLKDFMKAFLIGCNLPEIK